MGWFDWFDAWHGYPPEVRAIIRKYRPVQYQLVRVAKVALSFAAVVIVACWVHILYGVVRACWP